MVILYEIWIPSNPSLLDDEIEYNPKQRYDDVEQSRRGAYNDLLIVLPSKFHDEILTTKTYRKVRECSIAIAIF